MSYYRSLIILFVLLAVAGVTGIVSQSESIRPNLPFEEFPLDLDNWKGRRTSLDAEVYNVLGVEDYVLANYHNLQGKGINLYVGFYQSQKEGDLIHSPKNCLPGAGWNIIDTTREKILFAGDKKPVAVVRLLLKKGSASQVVLYWFQSRGRLISSEYMQKIWLVWDSITKQRTDGSFVRLISPVDMSDGGVAREREAKTLELLKEFAKQIKPHLDAHIPS